jgi:hypothetical protein
MTRMRKSRTRDDRIRKIANRTPSSEIADARGRTTSHVAGFCELRRDSRRSKNGPGRVNDQLVFQCRQPRKRMLVHYGRIGDRERTAQRLGKTCCFNSRRFLGSPVRSSLCFPLSEQPLSGRLGREEKDLPKNHFRTRAHRIGVCPETSSFRPRMIQDLRPARN